MADEGIDIERLMLEKLANVIDENDDLLLSRLLSENETYQKRYEQLQDFYQKEGLDQKLDQPSLHAHWTKVAERIKVRQRAAKKRKRKIMTLAVAAVVTVPLLLLVSGWYWGFWGRQAPQRVADNQVRLLLAGGQSIVLGNQKDSSQKNVGNKVQLNLTQNRLSYSVKDKLAAQQLNVLDVPLTQTYQVVLSDGTTVWLNAKSSLKFPFVFSGSTREVYLRGEAYFKVAKDTRHPFIVHTASTDIRDLGTAFDVNAYDSTAIMTSLVEGVVITSTKDGYSKQLVPGQRALFRPGKDFKVDTFDAESLLSWRKGIYYFNHTPLGQIGPVIYRWFGKNVVFNQPEVAAYAFTGAIFKDKSLNEFLENLFLTSNIKYKIKGNQVFLSNQ